MTPFSEAVRVFFVIADFTRFKHPSGGYRVTVFTHIKTRLQLACVHSHVTRDSGKLRAFKHFITVYFQDFTSTRITILLSLHCHIFFVSHIRTLSEYETSHALVKDS